MAQDKIAVDAPTGGKRSILQKFTDKYWLIEQKEKRKAYPLMLMLSLICFSYTLLRDLKDIMVFEIGKSELISYLKLLGTLPVSIIFMMAYAKMSTNKSKPFIFYSMLGFFLSLYAFIMAAYAFKQHLQPKKGSLVETFPPAMEHLATILENWIIVLVFIFGEMYGTISLSLLFWGFANDICTVDEAQRFYPLINLIANVALVILGMILIVANEALKTNKDLFLQISLATVILLNLVVAYTYRWMQQNVLTDPELYDPGKVKKKKAKAKMGMLESMKFVFSSGYVAKIAIMVVGYGMVINFMEIYYKNILNLTWLESTITGKGLESGVTGMMVILLSLFIGTTAVARFGWTKTALATPALLAVFGLPFLIIQLILSGKLLGLLGQLSSLKKANQAFGPVSENEHYGVVLPIYIFGFLTVVCAKSFKYSFFDPTKEMAYIPLDSEIRGQAKAAVDVVGARFGKSGASALFILLNAIPAFDNNSLNYVHTILALFIVVLGSWMYSTISLGRQFDAKNKESEEEAIQAAAEKGCKK